MSTATIPEVRAVAVTRTAKGARVYDGAQYREIHYTNATRFGGSALLNTEAGTVMVFGPEALLDELTGRYRPCPKWIPSKGFAPERQGRRAAALLLPPRPLKTPVAKGVAAAVEVWSRGGKVADACAACGVTVTDWGNCTRPGAALYGARERAKLARKLAKEENHKMSGRGEDGK